MTHQVIALARLSRASAGKPTSLPLFPSTAPLSAGRRPDVAMMVALRYLAARRRTARAAGGFAKPANAAE
jgi:hypothetical protein